MPGRLEGKVALITGGGSGIGRASAERFAAEGARVCVVDRSLEGAAETVQRVEAAGGQAFAAGADVTDEAALDGAVRRCVETYGALDCVVAAAGIAQAPGQQGGEPLWQMPLAAFDGMLDVNLRGVLLTCRAAVRAMLNAGRPGAIVTISSGAARLPLAGAGHYCIAKAGVWMLTKVLALELAGQNIRVNAIGPGYIDTPMTQPMHQSEERLQRILRTIPMHRMGEPEEIASTALFLCSDDASYFTGQMLHPAGGLYLD
ncbi:MAG TPA: SDR family NAD(P)-dependent oxidoreductase [Dehalococcoidia bacterium]|nr:SDR family NAD(P)-dependent oxidoreductase [Dehalococcoidia bacterium]